MHTFTRQQTPGTGWQVDQHSTWCNELLKLTRSEDDTAKKVDSASVATACDAHDACLKLIHHRTVRSEQGASEHCQQPCNLGLLQDCHTLARYDLPVPGGPNSSSPLQGFRLPVKNCGNFTGRMTASLSASFAPSNPATSSHCIYEGQSQANEICSVHCMPHQVSVRLQNGSDTGL